MRRVYQRVVEDGYGDCFAAALASILEIDLGDVPVLPRSVGPGDGAAWRAHVDVVSRWLASWRSLRLWAVPFYNQDGEGGIVLTEWDNPPPSLWIACVKSHRDDWGHAVVCRGGEVVHDPIEGRTVGRLSYTAREGYLLLPSLG